MDTFAVLSRYDRRSRWRAGGKAGKRLTCYVEPCCLEDLGIGCLDADGFGRGGLTGAVAITVPSESGTVILAGSGQSCDGISITVVSDESALTAMAGMPLVVAASMQIELRLPLNASLPIEVSFRIALTGTGSTTGVELGWAALSLELALVGPVAAHAYSEAPTAISTADPITNEQVRSKFFFAV